MRRTSILNLNDADQNAILKKSARANIDITYGAMDVEKRSHVKD